MEKTQMVIGFMFTNDMKQILLILKNHGPQCVIGRHNGIGGHFELTDADPMACQIREFEEETGIKTTRQDWAKFTELRGKDFIVHCFYGLSSRAVLNAKTMTDEKIEIVNCENTGSMNIFNIPLAPNLVWWIPFLRDVSTKNHLCVVLANYMQDDELDADTVATI